MKKILMILTLTALLYPFALMGAERKLGFGIFGGLGWGDGVYTAAKGSEYPYSGVLHTYQNPESDSAYSADYGLQIYYFHWENVAFTFGVSSETKRLMVLYPYNEDADPKDDWKGYEEYTLKAQFTTFSLGARYYTSQEYLFGGKVFFGAGAYYGFHKDSMEITVEDVELNHGWFATLMLFDVMNIARKKNSTVYEGKNSGLKDDKGLFIEAGMVYPINDWVSFDFFVKYSFGLSKIYDPAASANPYDRTLRDYTPRTFLMNISFTFLFGLGSETDSSYSSGSDQDQSSSLQKGAEIESNQ